MAKRITKDDFRPTPKKIRRRRKPMTEEQKAAAVERLRKAREAKAAANPTKPANVCDHVLNLPEDHYLSYVKVKGWIKSNQEAPSLLYLFSKWRLLYWLFWKTAETI